MTMSKENATAGESMTRCPASTTTGSGFIQCDGDVGHPNHHSATGKAATYTWASGGEATIQQRATSPEPKPAMPSGLAKEIITRLVTNAIQSTFTRNLSGFEADMPSEKDLIDDALAIALGDEVGCLAEEEWTSEHIDLLWLEDKLAAYMPTRQAAVEVAE